jgi:YcxB-like protein
MARANLDVQAISFSVSYGLREYLSFVRDHLPAMLEMMVAEGKVKRMPSKLWYPVFLVGSTVAFFYKKHRMPVCDFVIDEKEIRRTTRGGTLVVPWSDLIAVRRYSRGFLLDKGTKGAMPLPYRCFSAEQMAAMEGLVRDIEAKQIHEPC